MEAVAGSLMLIAANVRPSRGGATMRRFGTAERPPPEPERMQAVRVLTAERGGSIREFIL